MFVKHGAVPARVGTVGAVAAAFALALVPLVPPGPRPADAPADAFSATRAMIHVRELAREPHPMGSQANARVGAYIAAELAALGLEVATQPIEVPDYFGAPGDTVAIVNIAGRISGTASTGAVVLAAHYDSDPTTPGANDNAAAVAALLEAARVLMLGEPLRNDIVILATDGEEPAPRYGANAYFDAHPWAADTAVVVNFEAVGRCGPTVLVETTSPDRWLVEAYRRTMTHPAAFSFLPDVVGRFGEIGTDFDVIRSRGVPGLHVAYNRGSPIYHTMADTPDAVGAGSLQHHGEHALGLARTLGSTDLDGPRPDEDAVVFTIGRRVITYSTGWAPATVALPVAGLAVALLRRRRRREGGLRSSVSAGFRSFAGCLAGAFLAALAWTLFTSVRSSPGVIESFGYLGLLLAGTTLLCEIVGRRGASTDRFDRLTGIVAVWAGLAVVGSLAAPRIGYLFVWPALAGAIAVSVVAQRESLPLRFRTWPIALVAFPSIVLMLPAIEIFLQFAQPRPGNPGSEMTAMIAVPVLLGGLTIELIRHTMAAGVTTEDTTR